MKIASPQGEVLDLEAFPEKLERVLSQEVSLTMGFSLPKGLFPNYVFVGTMQKKIPQKTVSTHTGLLEKLLKYNLRYDFR